MLALLHFCSHLFQPLSPGPEVVPHYCETYLDRLELRYDHIGEALELAEVDVVVSTAALEKSPRRPVSSVGPGCRLPNRQVSVETTYCTRRQQRQHAAGKSGCGHFCK